MVNPADELMHLRAEHARLVALLESHGIAWHAETEKDTQTVETTLSTRDKINVFRRLFRGRDDVYALRWESKTGKSGYSPACGNEWKPGLCEKPQVVCAACAHRQLLPITDQVIFDHLSGRKTIGVYPLRQDDTCYFLAVDFDEADWQHDARAFVQISCAEVFPHHIALPRGCLDAVLALLHEHGIGCRLQDERTTGTPLEVRFNGQLRADQQTAMDDIPPTRS